MKTWDSNQGADTCVRMSLWTIAKKLQIPEWAEYFGARELCRLTKWTGHRKSSNQTLPDGRVIHAYTWDRTEDIRRTLQKFIPWTMYAGLNGDQYRAYFLVLAHDRDLVGALKVMFGFVYRAIPLFLVLKLLGAGWLLSPFIAILFSPFPSLMEIAIMKPHTFLMLFKVHPIFSPFYYMLYPIWLFSKWRNLKQSIAKGTTNKITLLIQMKMLGVELKKPFWWVIKVYTTYFVAGTENYFIGQECIDALSEGGKP